MLSAGGVGLSFKSGCSKPRLYDQGKSPNGESIRSRRCVRRREMILLGANRIDHQKANGRVDHDLAPRALPCKLAQNNSG